MNNQNNNQNDTQDSIQDNTQDSIQDNIQVDDVDVTGLSEYSDSPSLAQRSIKYFVAIGIGLCITFVALYLRGMFDSDINTDTNMGYRILSDCFFLTSVLFIGGGLLAAVSGQGMFDALGFSFEILGSMFKKDVRNRKHKDLYEYRVSKKHDEKKTPWFLVFVGVGFLLVSILYNSMFIPVA